MIQRTQQTRSDFAWIEEVRGPLSNRGAGGIVQIGGGAPPPCHHERYRSIYVSNEQLPDYVGKHKGDGNTSGIKGFAGPCTILNIPFDIDRETKSCGTSQPDWDRAICDARQFLEALRVLHDVELGMVKCCLTGGRGVHIYLPAGFFGGFEPSEHVPDVVRSIATELAADAAIKIDTVIYDRNRLLRVPNSRHPSGKYCVPLYASELIHIDTDDLVSMMDRPRTEVSWLGEVDAVQSLVELKRRSETAVVAAARKPSSYPEPPEGREAEVLTFLEQRGVEFTRRGDDFVTRCPTGTHDDRDASFCIQRRSGICHCFGCEVKGNWERCKELLEERRVVTSSEGNLHAPTLVEVKNAFRRWLYLEDDTFIDVGLAVIVAHQFEGDPVWMFLVGPPGSCKTEFLRALTCAHTYQLSSLTQHSLVSGLNLKDKDPSLLPKLDGKVLVIKDFTTVLSARNEVRAEIFGQLRDVYDGYFQKHFGSGVDVRSYNCHLGVMAGVTSEIERYHSVDQALGERFLRLRLSYDHPDEPVRRARRNAGEQKRMREELGEVARRFLEQPWPSTANAVSVSEEYCEKIDSLASLLALLRTAVSKDHKGRLEYVPMPEVGTRLAIQLTKLGAALTLVRGKTAFGDDEYDTLVRVGRDTLPSLRWRFIKGLVRLHEAGGWYRTQDIGSATGISSDTAKENLHDLMLLEIVERRGASQFEWRLTERVLRLFDIAELLRNCEETAA